MTAKRTKRSVPSGDVFVSKIPLRLTNEERTLVDRLRREAARLWNDILDLHWWLWDTWKIWINENELKKWFNAKTHQLHSQTIQAIIELHQETIERTRQLRNDGNKDWKYPWRYKTFFSVRYKKNAIHIKGNQLILSNGRKEANLVVKIPRHIDSSAIKHAEIVWTHNQYWLHLAIEHPKKEQVSGTAIAGGDPGEIHALTLSDGKQHVLFTGKHLRSLKRLRNKKLAWYQRRISRTKKDSQRRWKLIKKKRDFLAWIDRNIDYAEHSLSKQAIEWAYQNGIATIYIGDPDGVQRKKKRFRKLNQKLNQWSFGELFRKIEYKGKRYGIKVIRIPESYTSGTCPSCGHYHKQSGRTFRCPVCLSTGHRDVIGAVNILDKALHGKITKGRSLPTYQETTYRQVSLTVA